MMWQWRYENAAGAVVPGPKSEEFSNQSDAESWLGENWRGLLDAGVEQVSLLEGEEVVYAAMSLRAAAE
ncbi:hypothetical protein [Yinghuangia soli]|uniref:Uncharacterized protein n=1 Tax=Yinghuangia soli TaxID=2908204 RepID=A0AA41Q586_9ACTN|nr:hypothetical protein [Yinghuangia soli]MCF2531200.1 hypothetical protein [Yinghuangia soli]